MRVFIISDTHFNPSKIETYCVRPEDYTKRIVKQWGSMVTDEDLIFHLGDVIIGDFQAGSELIKSLPGRKILVMGNHDMGKSASWWMSNGFDFAAQSIVFRDYLLTHAPIKHLPSGGLKGNIHGHLHINRKSWESLQPHNRLFCLEYLDYKPIIFDKFVSSSKYDIKQWAKPHLLPY